MLSLTVGESYSLNFTVLLRFSPAFVVVGRCHYIALKCEELAPPTPFERMRAVNAFLLRAPTLGRKMSSKVFLLNYCQDVFLLGFLCQMLSCPICFPVVPSGKAESVC